MASQEFYRNFLVFHMVFQKVSFTSNACPGDTQDLHKDFHVSYLTNSWTILTENSCQIPVKQGSCQIPVKLGDSALRCSTGHAKEADMSVQLDG